MKTHAGWYGTEKRWYQLPSLSSTLGNVNECRATNSAYADCVPYQPTPITVTFPSYSRASPSTEGASKLHAAQPGAQNQRATGRIASASSSAKEPPPMSVAPRSNLPLSAVTAACVLALPISVERDDPEQAKRLAPKQIIAKGRDT